MLNSVKLYSPHTPARMMGASRVRFGGDSADTQFEQRINALVNQPIELVGKPKVTLVGNQKTRTFHGVGNHDGQDTAQRVKIGGEEFELGIKERYHRAYPWTEPLLITEEFKLTKVTPGFSFSPQETVRYELSSLFDAIGFIRITYSAEGGRLSVVRAIKGSPDHHSTEITSDLSPEKKFVRLMNQLKFKFYAENPHV